MNPVCINLDTNRNHPLPHLLLVCHEPCSESPSNHHCIIPRYTFEELLLHVSSFIIKWLNKTDKHNTVSITEDDTFKKELFLFVDIHILDYIERPAECSTHSGSQWDVGRCHTKSYGTLNRVVKTTQLIQQTTEEVTRSPR